MVGFSCSVMYSEGRMERNVKSGFSIPQGVQPVNLYAIVLTDEQVHDRLSMNLSVVPPRVFALPPFVHAYEAEILVCLSLSLHVRCIR